MQKNTNERKKWKNVKKKTRKKNGKRNTTTPKQNQKQGVSPPEITNKISSGAKRNRCREIFHVIYSDDTITDNAFFETMIQCGDKFMTTFVFSEPFFLIFRVN